MKKNLYIDPYIGEFGWELFCWQGFLRRRAKDYEHVTVVCKTGHDFLYRDFANTIIHFNLNNDTEDMWMNKSSGFTPLQLQHHMQYAMGVNENFDVIKYDEYKSRWWDSEHLTLNQDIMSFNRWPSLTEIYIDDKYLSPIADVLICVRNTGKCNTSFRNWSVHGTVNHAKDFVKAMNNAGLTVGCVGKSMSALHIDGTEDYRDISLDDLTAIMSNSNVLVAPVSGTIHLAALCNLPQVTWATKNEHIDRIETSWNPFNTKVYSLRPPAYNGDRDGLWRNRLSYTPSVSQLVKGVNSILRRD